MDRKLLLLVIVCLMIVPSTASQKYWSGYITGNVVSDSSDLMVGDVNGDGSVDSMDAQQVARYLEGMDTSYEVTKQNADVTYDGQITSADSDKIAACGVGSSRCEVPQSRYSMAVDESGTSNGWQGCRGTGAQVCSSLVDDSYFDKYPDCRPNNCEGQFYQCNGDLCPEPENFEFCEDSDGGFEPFEFGYVSSSANERAEDICSDSNTVSEATCPDSGDVPQYESYDCPNGCENGACLNESSKVSCDQASSSDSCLDNQDCYWDQDTDKCYSYDGVSSSSCSDPDGGRDESTRAHTFGFRENCANDRDCRIRTGGRDSCLSSNEVREHYCSSGYIRNVNIDCPNGCEDGRCVEEVEKVNDTVIDYDYRVGDVNSDGEVDVTDAQIVERDVEGYMVEHSVKKENADVTLDGKVDGHDADMIAGCSVGKWSCDTLLTNYASASSRVQGLPVGDVNWDGSINSIDAQQVQRFVDGYSTSSFIYPANADADLDGKVTASDADRINKCAVGTRSCTTTQGGYEGPRSCDEETYLGGRSCETPVFKNGEYVWRLETQSCESGVVDTTIKECELACGNSNQCIGEEDIISDWDVMDTLKEGERKSYSINGKGYTVMVLDIEGEVKYSVNGGITDLMGDLDTEDFPDGLILQSITHTTLDNVNLAKFALHGSGDRQLSKPIRPLDGFLLKNPYNSQAGGPMYVWEGVDGREAGEEKVLISGLPDLKLKEISDDKFSFSFMYSDMRFTGYLDGSDMTLQIVNGKRYEFNYSGPFKVYCPSSGCSEEERKRWDEAACSGHTKYCEVEFIEYDENVEVEEEEVDSEPVVDAEEFEGCPTPTCEEPPEGCHYENDPRLNADGCPVNPCGNLICDQQELRNPDGSCNGCEMNDQCVPIGTRMEYHGRSAYCGIEGLGTQKDVGSSCQNNYECATNECSSGECVDLQAQLEDQQRQLEEQANILERIMGWLGKLFG